MILGKISNVKFGKCGYDNAGIGFVIEITCSDGIIFQETHCMYNFTYTQNRKSYAYAYQVAQAYNYLYILTLMQQAQCDVFEDLIGTPVEILNPNTKEQSFRILTEVL